MYHAHNYANPQVKEPSPTEELPDYGDWPHIGKTLWGTAWSGTEHTPREKRYKAKVKRNVGDHWPNPFIVLLCLSRKDA